MNNRLRRPPCPNRRRVLTASLYLLHRRSHAQKPVWVEPVLERFLHIPPGNP